LSFFLGFIVFYLFLTFYLLPALSAILKVRKRKLAQTSTTSNANNLTGDITTNTISAHSNSIIVDFSSKLNNVNDTQSSQPIVLGTALNTLSVKVETLRKFKIAVLSPIQLTTFLYM
jgi:hypothetical protein